MNDSVLTRITLSGSLRGSARLVETAGKTRVTLSVPAAPEGLYIIACGEGGCRRAELAGNGAELPMGGVCALALCRGGRVLAKGFAGSCQRMRPGIESELRIMAAQGADTLPAPRAHTEKRTPPQAPAPGRAAQSIIEQARRLFSALDPPGAPPAEAPREEPAEELEYVHDPFPRTFPHSVWRKRPGEETLYGELVIRGVRRRAAAVPADMKAGEGVSRIRGSILRDKNGRAYRIELR